MLNDDSLRTYAELEERERELSLKLHQLSSSLTYAQAEIQNLHARLEEVENEAVEWRDIAIDLASLLESHIAHNNQIANEALKIIQEVRVASSVTSS